VHNFDIRVVLTGQLTYGGKQWQVTDVLDMICMFSLEATLGDRGTLTKLSRPKTYSWVAFNKV
jgi:hypothetical protein